MSGTAVMDAIGLVSGLLGIVQFMQDNFPEKPPQGASVRVKAGNPGDDNPGMVSVKLNKTKPSVLILTQDGDISHAYAWDFGNNYLGQADGAHLEIGDAATLTIDSFSSGSRADYIGVAADKNAVCISWISVTMFDETPGGAWTGDVGYQCGQNWYEQGEMAGYMDKDQKEEYIPKCTWLDADHSDGVPSAALKFKATAYGHDVSDVTKNGEGCKWTTYGPDNGPIYGKRTSFVLPQHIDRLTLSCRKTWREAIYKCEPCAPSLDGEEAHHVERHVAQGREYV